MTNATAVRTPTPAESAWRELLQGLRTCIREQALLPQLKAHGIAQETVATFLAIGGLRWWSGAESREGLREAFLAEFSAGERVPPAPIAFTATSPDPTWRSSVCTSRYNPGDSQD